MFGRLKDWRRIHTRYDRCAHTFMSAICIAASRHLLALINEFLSLASESAWNELGRFDLYFNRA